MTTTMLTRGATRRCARCGGRGLFDGYFTMKEECPTCGLRFAHEDGYWTGAMMINIAVTEVVFLGLFATLVVAWWPDPPWVTILVILVAVNLVLPVVFHPVAKTLWVAADLAVRSRTEAAETAGSDGRDERPER